MMPDKQSSLQGKKGVYHALIVGGGIGGLAAALALRRTGQEVTVLEKASQLLDTSGGMVLFPNATVALKRLGCAEEDIPSIGITLHSMDFYTPQGVLFFQRPFHTLARIFGAPALAVYRADLQTVLLQYLGIERVYLNAQCIGSFQNESGIQVQLADGRAFQGDFLIGADGLRSRLREQLFGAKPLRYAGYTIIRGVLPFGEHRLLEPGTLSLTCGKDVQFGIARLTQGRVYWFIRLFTPPGSIALSKPALLALFADWHEPIRALLEQTEEATLLQHDIYDLQPLTQWGLGRATLLGDAAHPMTTLQSQGACQALEDAQALQWSFQRSTDPIEALRTYETLRISRATMIVHFSQRTNIPRSAQYLAQVPTYLQDESLLIK